MGELSTGSPTSHPGRCGPAPASPGDRALHAAEDQVVGDRTSGGPSATCSTSSSRATPGCTAWTSVAPSARARLTPEHDGARRRRRRRVGATARTDPTGCGSTARPAANGRRATAREAGARCRGVLPAAVRPWGGRRPARPGGSLLRSGDCRRHQPWTRRASATTRSKRAWSSAAPSRRTRQGRAPAAGQADLAWPARESQARSPVGPDPAVAASSAASRSWS